MVVCKTCTFIYPQQSVQSMGQCISVCDCLPCCVGENELWKFRKKQILLFFGKAMVCLPFKVLSYLKTKKGVYCYWQLIGAEKVFLKKKIWCINMLKQRYQLRLQILRMAFNTYARRCKSTGVLRVFIVWKGRHEQISISASQWRKPYNAGIIKWVKDCEDLENIIKPEPKFLLVISHKVSSFSLKGILSLQLTHEVHFLCMAAHQLLQWPERKWCLKFFYFILWHWWELGNYVEN